MTIKEYRPHELDLKKSIGITEEIHCILKKERRNQKKSMARIVNDLILVVYDNKSASELVSETLSD
jgi:hypothetical protein